MKNSLNINWNIHENKKIKIKYPKHWNFLPKIKKGIISKQSFSVAGKIWVNSIFFIIFSFLNISLPIIICLISANLDKYGAYAAMGIGYVTTFQLAFSQVGFSFSIFSSFLYFKILKKKHHQKEFQNVFHDVIYDILFLALIYGFIITPIYISSSYVYTKYANAHYNTVDSLKPAYDFIFSSCGYTFLVSILYTLIMVIHNKRGQLISITYLIILFGLISLLSSTLGILTNLKGVGVGLGMTLGVIITLVIVLIDCYFITNIFKTVRFKIKGQYLKLVLENTWRPSVTTLSIQVFKGCALLLLSYQIPDALKNSVPLDYQMARIIWYNIMYFIPFIFLGMADSIYFFFLKEDESILKGVNKNFVLLFIGISILIITVILTVVGSYLVDGLAIAYTKNQDHTYSNQEISQNLQNIGKSKLIEYINSDATLTDEQKNYFINYINQIPDDKLNQIMDPILQKTILPKFISFSSTNIDNILIFPESFSYFYLCFYCILYPLGQYMNAYANAITKEKPKTLLLVIIQGLAILFVVEFGIHYQETQKFYLMEAWSFPLLIIGIVAFAYLSLSSLFILNKYNREQAIIEYQAEKLLQ